MNTKCCEVCGEEFELRKNDIYIADVFNSPFEVSAHWNAIDCPKCGCQILLKRRYNGSKNEFPSTITNIFKNILKQRKENP